MIDFKKNLGLKLAAIWLILMGVTQLVSLSFTGLHLVAGALAIAAGVFVLLDR